MNAYKMEFVALTEPQVNSQGFCVSSKRCT
ncbi:hypothetical protein Xekj_01242 [Xenorhabdus sp. KJ12.1]|nr:hypothetical protein Xekj_01242 [Xenorhabdus sp. KJ12.1]